MHHCVFKTHWSTCCVTSVTLTRVWQQSKLFDVQRLCRDFFAKHNAYMSAHATTLPSMLWLLLLRVPPRPALPTISLPRTTLPLSHHGPLIPTNPSFRAWFFPGVFRHAGTESTLKNLETLHLDVRTLMFQELGHLTLDIADQLSRGGRVMNLAVISRSLASNSWHVLLSRFS